MPHHAQIQRAFGRHDISGIGAHTSREAESAATSMGARAFAYGSDVAFAGAPDLFTAAHEAAHVVQQRGGLQLPGGVGAEGDASERHADAVAERVVQGGSAADLLDGVAAADANDVRAPVLQHKLKKLGGTLVEEDRSNERFDEEAPGAYRAHRDGKTYWHQAGTDQFVDAENFYLDPVSWELLEKQADGHYIDSSGYEFTYELGLYQPFVPPAAAPPPAAAAASSSSATKRPLYTQPGTAGPSSHFGSKLPPRVKGSDSIARYRGGHLSRFKQIMPVTKRANLTDKHTKDLVAADTAAVAAGHPVTAEAHAMTAPGATLSGVGAQRNHVIAAETANRFFAAVLATLTDSTKAEYRTRAITDGWLVARALTNDIAIADVVRSRLEAVVVTMDKDTAAQLASELGKRTADHTHNLAIGHGGKNATMSNRTDVTTSPGRTHILDKDAQIIEDCSEPFSRQLGEKLARDELEVPTTPGGWHIMSSKQLMPPSSSAPPPGGM